MTATEELRQQWLAEGHSELVVRRPGGPAAVRDDTWIVDVSDPAEVTVRYHERGQSPVLAQFATEGMAVAWIREETTPLPEGNPLTAAEQGHAAGSARRARRELEAQIAAADAANQAPAEGMN